MEIFTVTSDATGPTITFESPTPSNTSSTASPVTIVANISDASNTSSWIDFNRDLLWYLPMDYYNSTHVFDNSSYKNNGTLYGTWNYSNANSTTGKRGYARTFNGVSDYIKSTHSALGINASFTMSCWIKTSSTFSYQPELSH